MCEFRRVIQTLGPPSAVLILAATVSAQSLPAPGVADLATHVNISAGVEQFALRDVSRNMRPVDASPISWEGRGPTVTAQYVRSTRKTSHIFETSVASARNFAYVAPTRSTDGLPGDRATRIEGRYEYRRYLWRDVGIDGFDVGVGAEGIGAYLALTRRIAPALESTTSLTGGGGALVLAGRLHRWDRVRIDATWKNGGIISRRHTEHSADATSLLETGGGSWLTAAAVSADVRISRSAFVSVGYLRLDEGYSSSHFSYAGRRRSMIVGVTYVR